ncbi:type VI secretion system transmembrane protein TssO [Chryseobacterium sp. GMJ5]|uniref:Type VI secretion system transmembrane protein TssO n=1 Tax=Chryseobacterium gilvum TaxID=2976534 RepID=A0ABT2VSU2_9FLAO|nr:type VI secretion system transmembrane protein TssO [Chryseobacterium gilvum]MCU7613051.1 type VI secretion system transmembrane protein TssO [Chryseobacterium gilvum]
MPTNREKKLNTSDVRIGIWKFILSFIILSVVSFCAVFFFFKSYDIQRKGIQKEIDDYRNLLSRNELLKIQVDSIQYRMTLLDINKVDNDILLRNYIMENVRDAKKIMGADSAQNFKHYSILLKKIEPMLALKSQIIMVSNKEQTAIRDLNACMGKVDRVNHQLRVDPTRKFTGRRR